MTQDGGQPRGRGEAGNRARLAGAGRSSQECKCECECTCVTVHQKSASGFCRWEHGPPLGRLSVRPWETWVPDREASQAPPYLLRTR